MTPNDTVHLQQAMLKSELIRLLQSRLILSVDYGDVGDDGTTVTISFMPEGSVINAT